MEVGAGTFCRTDSGKGECVASMLGQDEGMEGMEGATDSESGIVA
jgi:hypothetical protein